MDGFLGTRLESEANSRMGEPNFGNREERGARGQAEEEDGVLIKDGRGAGKGLVVVDVNHGSHGLFFLGFSPLTF